MSRVTSKLQVTVPKAIADTFGIRPGDEVEWEAAGDVIRVVPARAKRKLSVAQRLKLFDQAMERQKERQRKRRLKPSPDGGRGWTRADLYRRGSSAR